MQPTQSRKNLLFGNRNELEWRGLIWISPVLIVLAFLDFYPIAYTIYLSFTDFSEFHFFNFSIVGIHNYIALFSLNSLLGPILLQTIEFAGGSILVMAPIGFILALLMTQKGMRGQKIYRTAILFPWAFPAFITILIWSGMLEYKFGIIDKVLLAMHLPEIPWLLNPSDAMISLILVNLWLSFPYYTYVFTASLQSIPNELYEAAEMDGYGSLQTLTKVTIPLLSRQISFIMIFGFIFTWNNFYVPFLLTGGGPGTSTDILVVYSYLDAFDYYNYAMAAAWSIVSILVLLMFVVIANKYTKMMSVLY